MDLLSELLGLNEAKKKCTCEDTGKMKCPMHGKTAMAEEHEDQDAPAEEGEVDIKDVPAKADGDGDDKDSYEDSADFTDEFFDMKEKIDHIKRVIHSKRFDDWLRETDTNYSTHAHQLVAVLKKEVDELDKSIGMVAKELAKADGLENHDDDDDDDHDASAVATSESRIMEAADPVKRIRTLAYELAHQTWNNDEAAVKKIRAKIETLAGANKSKVMPHVNRAVKKWNEFADDAAGPFADGGTPIPKENLKQVDAIIAKAQAALSGK